MFASILHWAISVPASLGKDALSRARREPGPNCFAHMHIAITESEGEPGGGGGGTRDIIGGGVPWHTKKGGGGLRCGHSPKRGGLRSQVRCGHSPPKKGS